MHPTHSEKGLRNYRCRKSSAVVFRDGRKEGSLHADKRGANLLRRQIRNLVSKKKKKTNKNVDRKDKCL